MWCCLRARRVFTASVVWRKQTSLFCCNIWDVTTTCLRRWRRSTLKATREWLCRDFDPVTPIQLPSRSRTWVQKSSSFCAHSFFILESGLAGLKLLGYPRSKFESFLHTQIGRLVSVDNCNLAGSPDQALNGGAAETSSANGQVAAHSNGTLKRGKSDRAKIKQKHSFLGHKKVRAIMSVFGYIFFISSSVMLVFQFYLPISAVFGILLSQHLSLIMWVYKHLRLCCFGGEVDLVCLCAVQIVSFQFKILHIVESAVFCGLYLTRYTYTLQSYTSVF